MKKSVVSVLVFCFISLSKFSWAAPAVQTKEVLKQIYQEKVTGFQYYSAYAEAAARGSEPVFSTLFETLAEAELVQAAECLKLLEDYGESMPEPVHATIHVAVVENNLEKLLAMEELLINQRYSAWMRKIREERQPEPLTIVTRIWRVDKQRYLLLQQMRTMMSGHSYAKIREFALCQVCGYTTFYVPKRFCPVCYQSPSYFLLHTVENSSSGKEHSQESDEPSFGTFTLN